MHEVLRGLWHPFKNTGVRAVLQRALTLLGLVPCVVSVFHSYIDVTCVSCNSKKFAIPAAVAAGLGLGHSVVFAATSSFFVAVASGLGLTPSVVVAAAAGLCLALSVFVAAT